MRSHPTKPSNQRTVSIANPVVWTSPADPPKVDKRDPNPGHGEQGYLRCPECGTLQSTIKASRNLFDLETMAVMGIKVGDILIRRHTPEGKNFRARAGDVRCKGSELPPR